MRMDGAGDPHHIMYEGSQFRGTPPPLPPPKSAKQRFLKAPLAAIKNALLKSTKPLRRQNSVMERHNERPRVSSLRRQHSMMEHRPPAWIMRSPEFGHREQRYYPDDMYDQQRFSYMRHEPYYQQHANAESNYANYGEHGHDDYGQASRPSGHFMEENLYANRALIELEKHAMASQHGPAYGVDISSAPSNGARIVRRHSMADRSASRESPMVIPGRSARGRYNISGDHSLIGDAPSSLLMETSQREEIYQTRSGAYMMSEQRVPVVTSRTRDEEAIYQSRREMHLDHLYQSKKEMQQRIHQGRMEVERAASSESPSIPSSAATTPTIAESNSSPIRDTIYQSRRELKERGFKTRTQLRDHIYQTRREAMESMAEPIYESSKQRQALPSPAQAGNCETESPKAIVPLSSLPPSLANTTTVFANQNSRNSSGSADITNEEETIIPTNPSELQKTKVNEFDATEKKREESADVTKLTMSPRADRSHISNIIKRIAPQPPLRSPTTACDSANAVENSVGAAQIHASRTSMETQYTSSQLSLPTGPPAAHSTPYASEAMLDPPNQMMIYPPLREPSTMRGTFDEHGGTLRDSVWNVSINIPSGAIAPGAQQEIYFTVTDPRMSQTVGGPPLDMENGWCFSYFLFFLHLNTINN